VGGQRADAKGAPSYRFAWPDGGAPSAAAPARRPSGSEGASACPCSRPRRRRARRRAPAPGRSGSCARSTAASDLLRVSARRPKGAEGAVEGRSRRSRRSGRRNRADKLATERGARGFSASGASRDRHRVRRGARLGRPAGLLRARQLAARCSASEEGPERYGGGVAADAAGLHAAGRTGASENPISRFGPVGGPDRTGTAPTRGWRGARTSARTRRPVRVGSSTRVSSPITSVPSTRLTLRAPPQELAFMPGRALADPPPQDDHGNGKHLPA